MATQVQFRRGTTAQNASFTGALGEVTVDTDKDTLVVHDGGTAGGFEISRADASNLKFPDGAVGTPAISFASDTNTGIYRGGTDILKFVTAGTDAVTIDASQNTTFAGTATMDGLTVDGNLGDFTVSSGGNQVTLDYNGFNYVNTSGTGAALVFRMNTPSKNTLRLDANNNISFYEDTGTTPKFIWDSSAESLTVDGVVTVDRVINATTSADPWLKGVNGSNTETFFLKPSGQAYFGGSVGIGTDSPASPSGFGSTNILHLKGSASNDCSIVLEGLFGSGGRQEIGVSTGDLYFNRGAATGSMSTSMVIDSSGNLLVGKTTTAIGTVGFRVDGGNGFATITRDGFEPLILNILTSDGDIAKFQKDGGTVGSIGSNTGYLYIGSPVLSDAFIGLGNSYIYPSDSTGGYRDNAIDLGYSTSRFKDLYLSGGVYLGGTGSANKLDDYEEGTWNPSAGAGLSVTGTFTSEGMYRKVGNIVTIQGTMQASSLSCSASSLIAGNLPFTASNTTNSYGGGTLFNNGGLEGGVTFILPNSTNLYSSRAMTSTTTIFFNAVYSTT
jgi:hypothetical protein